MCSSINLCSGNLGSSSGFWESCPGLKLLHLVPKLKEVELSSLSQRPQVSVLN
jgi:hypothetical protein